MQDSPEFSKRLKEETKSFSSRIEHLLQPPGVEDKEGVVEIDFTNEVGNKIEQITLGLIPNEGVWPGYPTNPAPPELFSYPMYTLEFMSDNKAEEYLSTTPYGPVPMYFIGADNNLYTCNNEYFMNNQGQAKKREWWRKSSIKGSLEEQIDDVGDLDTYKLIKVNFTPSRQGSRYVDLEIGDFEKIGHLLGRIEAGELS